MGLWEELSGGSARSKSDSLGGWWSVDWRGQRASGSFGGNSLSKKQWEPELRQTVGLEMNRILGRAGDPGRQVGTRGAERADGGSELDASEMSHVAMPENCSWVKGQRKGTCQVAREEKRWEARR